MSQQLSNVVIASQSFFSSSTWYSTRLKHKDWVWQIYESCAVLKIMCKKWSFIMMQTHHWQLLTNILKVVNNDERIRNISLGKPCLVSHQREDFDSSLILHVSFRKKCIFRMTVPSKRNSLQDFQKKCHRVQFPSYKIHHLFEKIKEGSHNYENLWKIYLFCPYPPFAALPLLRNYL